MESTELNGLFVLMLLLLLFARVPMMQNAN